MTHSIALKCTADTIQHWTPVVYKSIGVYETQLFLQCVQSDSSSEDDEDESREETCTHLESFGDLPLTEVANQSQWNFFEIVSVVEEKFNIDLIENEHLYDPLYKCLESKASTEMEAHLLQLSFRAFLATRNIADEDVRVARMINGEIVTDSDSETELGKQIDSEIVKKMILKRQESIKRQNQRRKAKLIVERNFLSRSLAKKVHGILIYYPNIGKEIEKFVTDRNIGADAWRRTGVLTFDGNQTIK